MDTIDVVDFPVIVSDDGIYRNERKTYQANDGSWEVHSTIM